ncbi:integration host factor subunit alpha [Desulfatibacillum aliphaticivorans]|uniref:integration host factor subunit alpha n=1 Tax=Desulfatibacillum aliphaticivorans TaxID=218208 RepID=UPI00040D880E|nr:integration host factor subunit alpha [Desulfatibacillum aliphaticivorans]
MTLTKNEIIEAIIKETGYPKRRGGEIMETLLEIIKEDLGSGNDLLISGFGKFSVKAKDERRGRNPATGEDLTLRSRRVVAFQCSAKLREKING